MEYLSGKRTAFTVPWAAAGTPFQKEAWEAVARIPYGQVRTTRELAGALGAPESCSASSCAMHSSTDAPAKRSRTISHTLPHCSTSMAALEAST